MSYSQVNGELIGKCYQGIKPATPECWCKNVTIKPNSALDHTKAPLKRILYDKDFLIVYVYRELSV